MALREVGVGWTRTSTKGNKFLSLQIKVGDRNMNLLVFKNTRKRTYSQPDYTVSLAVDDTAAATPRPVREPSQASPQPTPVQKPKQVQGTEFDKFYDEPAGDGPAESEDDLPF